MKLRDLLDELRRNMLRDVSTAVSGGASDGSLWSDEALTRYIRDAEEKFARRTGCIRDAVPSDATSLLLGAGEAAQQIHQSIIEVLSAAVGSVVLRRANVGALPAAAAGTPVWFSVDETAREVVVYPTPTAPVTVQLLVSRLPIVPLSLANLDAVPEVPPEYHLDLLEWAAYLALRNHDADIDAEEKAAKHLERFNTAVDTAAAALRRVVRRPTSFGATDVGYLLTELRTNVTMDMGDAALIHDDATLIRYIGESEHKFARATRSLRDDTTPSIAAVAITAGVAQYALHASVLEVITASIGGVQLRHANAGSIAGVAGDPGTPVWFSVDESTKRITLYPTPDTTTTLNLRAARLPIQVMSASDLTAIPELPEDYRLDMLGWAAYRALRSASKDEADVAKANAYRDQFDAAVATTRADIRKRVIDPLYTPTVGTLGYLLVTLRNALLADVDTGPRGLRWDDAELIQYINDAEEKFAAGTLCLRDSKTAATCTITLADGVSEYLMDRRVIACYAATYNGNIALGRTSHATRFGARGDITPKTATREPMATGEPRLFYTDRDTGYIGFYPTPGPGQVGDTVRIQVARRPIVPLSRDDLAAIPEIPVEYQLDLLEWAAYRALRKSDMGIAGDPNNISIVMALANMHKKRFEDAMTECKRKNKYMNTQHVEFGVNANWS